MLNASSMVQILSLWDNCATPSNIVLSSKNICLTSIEPKYSSQHRSSLSKAKREVFYRHNAVKNNNNLNILSMMRTHAVPLWVVWSQMTYCSIEWVHVRQKMKMNIHSVKSKLTSSNWLHLESCCVGAVSNWNLESFAMPSRRISKSSWCPTSECIAFWEMWSLLALF